MYYDTRIIILWESHCIQATPTYIPVEVNVSSDRLSGILTLVVSQLETLGQNEEPLATDTPLLDQPTCEGHFNINNFIKRTFELCHDALLHLTVVYDNRQ